MSLLRPTWTRCAADFSSRRITRRSRPPQSLTFAVATRLLSCTFLATAIALILAAGRALEGVHYVHDSRTGTRCPVAIDFPHVR